MTSKDEKFTKAALGRITSMVLALMCCSIFGHFSVYGSPVPDIKLNNSNGEVAMTTQDILSVTVQLDAGNQVGENADWWIFADTPTGSYSYIYPTGWNYSEAETEEFATTYQGPLFTLMAPVELLHLTDLQVGEYTFHFGVDTNMNGTLEKGKGYYYDSASVSVMADTGWFPLVDTSQTACYDDFDEMVCPKEGGVFYGQDSQHDGNQPRYTDNGDGTVTDHLTDLMWQQNPDLDGDGDIDALDKRTYAQGQAYVDELNAQNYCGYSDWRLPTIKQLYSLMDFRGTDPMSDDPDGLVPFIDDQYFDFAYGDLDSGERIIDSQWMTSTLYTADSNMMFGVNFADGRIKGYGMESLNPAIGEKTFYVRYCRGNINYGRNHFRDNDDGTVTDDATGLMWTRSDSGQSMNWEDALAWAAQKNAESHMGYNDWRLPNAKELQSIVDYTRSPDTTESAAIDPVFNSTAIVNEYGDVDYPYYWTGTTHLSQNGKGTRAVYIAFGRGLGSYDGENVVDVHGAGCQRSDPKDGNENDYPSWGNGPQGDVQRMLNYVRLVRDPNLKEEIIAE